MSQEDLIKARDCLAFAVDDLVAANTGAPAVVSYILMPLIARAATLHADLRALCNALESDTAPSNDHPETPQ